MNVRTFLVIALCFFGVNLYAQRSIDFNDVYIGEDNPEWKDYKVAPDFVRYSVEMKYAKEHTCEYFVHESLEVESKTWNIFTIRFYNSHEFEVFTYISTEVSEKLYLSHLIIYGTNYQSGMYPVAGIYSFLRGNKIAIYANSVLAETVDLTEW